MKDFSLVYIIGTYPGLTTTFIDREIRALRAKGVYLRVVAIRKSRAKLSTDQERLQGITSYLLPIAWGQFLKGHLRFLLKKPVVYFSTLIQLLTSPHPDLATRLKTVMHFAEGVYAAERIYGEPCDHIHAHFVDRASSVALVASRLLNVPYSVTAHANDIYVKPVLLDLKLSNASFVSTCTGYNHQHLQQTFKLNGKLHCFYHGLELEAYQPQAAVSSEVPLITSVGQLKEKKGFTYLLQACQILKARGYAFRCQIVGEGPLRDALEQQIRDFSLEKHVTLCGAIPHDSVIQKLRISTMFVLPCVTSSDGDRDGIPNAILEAMAMQLPVVSTAHSGIPEVISDGVNGFLVPSADATALAEKMAELLDRPTLRQRMGEHGRQMVSEKFDVTNNAHRLLEQMVNA
ncbi:MAG TPA: glycosyltransferase [Anaerolineales bacterium]|nr:glycosyltransferase [Anaerolineales bacterium]